MIARFGLFEFDTGSRELRRQGRLVRLEPQPARALALLVERAGEMVTRDDLRAHVWDAGTHVDFDRGLTYCIGQVRAALGDAGDNPRFVETLPKRGYRFIAPVQHVPAADAEEVAVAPASHAMPAMPVRGADEPRPVGDLPLAAAAPPAVAPVPGPASMSNRSGWPGRLAAAVMLTSVTLLVWTAWARMTPARPIVAVAVFDNETGRPEFDRLAATAADIVVERLTALGADAIGIIGQAPTLRRPRDQREPAAIRAETGAGYFVFGQVQDDEAGVRLVVHLIRLDDDTHLWVTRVARPPGALGNIQDLVADRLAEAVRRHVIDRDPKAPRFTR